MTDQPTLSQQPSLTQHKITVLMIDDQPIMGEAVRRMVVKDPDIVFHYCKDPNKALEIADQVKPTVVLVDLVMPEVDGLTLVKRFRENEATRDTPMIVLSSKGEGEVKADAFTLGVNDYMVKLPHELEVLARIRYHSRGYINLLQRNEAYQKLLASQKALAEDVAQAAAYVQSLLPPPIKGTNLCTDWRFIPSSDLGGDAFGYHDLDERHFACYLLDVCGHGVGAALLSVSVLNALRSQSLPQTDFRKPEQVLTALNKAFPMEKHNGKFFTIWYGVVDRQARQLVYSVGGHPPALLLHGPDIAGAKLTKLEGDGLMIGAMDDIDYDAKSCPLDAFNRLYLYSDGAFEIQQKDDTMMEFDDFVALVGKLAPGSAVLDGVVQHISSLGKTPGFVDDVSLVELEIR